MKRYDVIGIGNALLDILVPVDDGLLGELGITRGAMELVTSERSDGLYRHLPEGRQRSGGSAANTIAGFAALGGSAGFIGKVGDDAFGDRFIADLQASNIAWFGKNMALQTITESERAGTGRCLVLISDDGQRSMCTWLGCAGLLHEGDVDQQAIAASRSLYLEGYLFDLPASKEAFFKAARIAREHKTVAALTLSDSFCVGRHREDFLHLIGQGIDILFANELEAMMLTETSDQKAMLAAIAECAPIVCVTLSGEGSILINRGTQHRIMAWHAGPLQDSTGAGDQYAAGFLFGQAQGWDLVRCGELASRLAGHTVTQYGARCEGEQIAAIRRDFAHIS